MKKILIAGGDPRQIYSAERLAEKYDTAVIGIDRKYFPEDSRLKTADISQHGEYDCIILPVPPLDNENNLSTPCSDEKLAADDIRKLLKDGGIVFAGRADVNTAECFDRAVIYDYMEREELCLMNAVPTAEGAVKLAIGEMPITLSGAKILIVGMGRIGTALAGILRGFSADITAAVRSAEGAAKARLAGVKSCGMQEMDTSAQLVFNTAPSLVFDREMLRRFGKNTLFIDLASKPGGIDFEAASELGIRAIWATGLPGKTAPVTAGEMIADTVIGILSERGEEHGG